MWHIYIFARKASLLGLALGDKRAAPSLPGIYPQNMFIIYTAPPNCKGFYKTAKEEEGLFKLHKRRNFFSLIKNYVISEIISISPCIILSCPFQKRPSSFLYLSRKCSWYLFEKKNLDLF